MPKDEDTRICIPHTIEKDCNLVGMLHCIRPARDTRRQEIALILHGLMGHKDYLFQKRLAYMLPMDSFRFDFRGNHESNGSWSISGVSSDVEDIQIVVSHLLQKHGYVVRLVIGHSKGSVSAMKWMATSPEGQNVTAFVNVSGRLRMSLIKDLWMARLRSSDDRDVVHKVTAQIAGKTYTKEMRFSDLDEYVNLNTTYLWETFPPHCDVLTIHGLSDQDVPPYDALLFARIFSTRMPNRRATHNLHFIEKANHNFSGHYEEVAETVCNWLLKRQAGTLKDGVWKAGERPKL